VGTALGRYNLHLGSDHQGTRLNKIYKENIDEEAILAELDILFTSFKNEKKEDEHFGDYAVRKQWV
jgi:sulfite reductase (NADPH) hemoprotein beta-component